MSQFSEMIHNKLNKQKDQKLTFEHTRIEDYLKDGEIDADDDFDNSAIKTAINQQETTNMFANQNQNDRKLQNLAKDADFGFDLEDDQDNLNSYQKSAEIVKPSQEQPQILKKQAFIILGKNKQAAVAETHLDSGETIVIQKPAIMKMARSAVEDNRQTETDTDVSETHFPIAASTEPSEEENSQNYKKQQQQKQQSKQQQKNQDKHQKNTNKKHKNHKYKQSEQSSSSQSSSDSEHSDNSQKAIQQPFKHQQQYQQQYQQQKQQFDVQEIQVQKNNRNKPGALNIQTAQKTQHKSSHKNKNVIQEKINESVSRKSSHSPTKKQVFYNQKIERDIQEKNAFEHDDKKAFLDETSDNVLEKVIKEGEAIDKTYKNQKSNSKDQMLDLTDLQQNNFNMSYNNDGDYNDDVVYKSPQAAQIQINDDRRKKISIESSDIQIYRKQQRQPLKEVQKEVKITKNKQQRLKRVKPIEQHMDSKLSESFSQYDEQISDSIYDEYNNLTDTQNSQHAPRNSQIRMLHTAQVEQSMTREEENEVKIKLDALQSAMINASQLAGKALAGYSTPHLQRELVKFNIDYDKLKNKRVQLNKVLGEEFEYENGRIVSVTLCLVKNEEVKQKQKLSFKQRIAIGQKRIVTEDSQLKYMKNNTQKELIPVIRNEAYDFEEINNGVVSSALLNINNQQQSIVALEPGAATKRFVNDGTGSVVVLSGEVVVKMTAENAVEYLLRKYDTLIMPKNVKIEIQNQQKQSVLLLTREK